MMMPPRKHAHHSLVLCTCFLLSRHLSAFNMNLPRNNVSPTKMGFVPNTRLRMTASEDRDSSDVDNSRRRQLLFSLLAASASPTMFSRSAFAEEEAASASTVTISKTVKDWSNIDIMKPPLDDRDYVTYIMDNGLRVLLCSDPTSTEAGAAMDVHVGACSDPEKVRGLAHFNEHMLFLGTKQYPQEDSFEAFLANNAGSSNAYTDSENTVYHFTMQAERDGKFQEGLSRFGSFFTSPLFTEGATERELNAIESENAKNLQSDNFRSYQIEKARQNPDHPHSKFFTGNKQTLAVDTRDAGLNLREQLIEFYGKYYSANQMTLAVVGPQSIDSLKAMVAEKFADIPNKGVPAPEEAWKGIIPIYNGASLIPSFGHVVKVVPVQDLRQVSLTWPIAYKDDQDRTNSLLTKQANYVGQLIAHEGPGSLLSHLKRQGWANSVGAATSAELSDYEAFLVTISLTVSGLSAINQVIEATFSYLKMLKEQVIPKYVFGEVLQIEELRWRFASKGSVSGYVQSLATSMQKYPPSLIVAGPRRLALAVDGSTLETTSSPRSYFSSIGQFDFTKDLTRDMIGQLTVDNALMTVMSKTFQGQTDKAEKWYGTEYSVERIPESTLNRWRDPAKPKKLGLDFPRKNVFIPSESGLNVKNTPPPIDRFRKRTFEERVEPIPPPRTVRDDGTEGRWTVYYKPDEKFGQPKAYIIFELLSKNVYSTAKNAALSNLYEYCVLDGLTEYAYDAGLAGLIYDVKVIPRGVRLTFGGYNDKLENFATYVSKKISEDIRDIIPNQKEFERFKDNISRGLAAFDVKQPYAHCSFYSALTMEPETFQYDNQELREAIEAATLEDMTSYVTTLWSSGKGVALVQGNLDEREAEVLVRKIDKTLGFSTISADEYPPELEPLPLPPISAKSMPTRLVIQEPNPFNGNAAVQVALQSLSEEPKEQVLMELISAIVSEPFFEDLRTKQQLGYIVQSGMRAVGKTRFLGFIIQSSVAPTEKLTAAVLKYLEKVGPSLLAKLNEGDFAVYVKSSIDRKTEPDKQLAQEVTRNWAEIGSGRLDFGRRQREVGALLDLSKDDLLDFWDRLYVKDGRRILITEMVPRIGPASSAAPPKSTGYASGNVVSGEPLVLGIDDIPKFRKDRAAISSTHIDLERVA